MVQMDRQLTASHPAEAVSTPPAVRPRLSVTDPARAALSLLRDTSGPHVIVLAWPGAVTTCPAGQFQPGPYHVIIGHVERCPMYADLRQLAQFPRTRVLLDANGTRLPRRLPHLRLRPIRDQVDTP
jgi:hypothetical protein